MILLSAEKISKSFLDKNLFGDLSLTLNEGDKIGVVGINGTGKSTLLKIMAQLETPDSGNITKASGIRIAYLPQNPVFGEKLTVLEQVFYGASPELKELKEYEAKAILNKLGLTDFSADVSRLSGGEKKRAAIAGALIRPSDILILDEPTNHLDNDMVNWLEKTLQKYTGAILMVTHDRYFLDRVTNRIAEIDKGSLYQYTCNYSQYLEVKAEREELALSTERKNKSLYRKELEWMMRGARARSTKSKDRIARFEKLRDRDIPSAGDKLLLSSIATRLGKKTIEIDHISKTYGSKQLIKDFSCIILRDARIGVIGKNGCGKSTLLRIIMGEIQPDLGKVVRGETVKIGYFSQEGEEMDTSLRVIDYIRGIGERIQTPDGTLSAAQMLEKFLFSADLQWNPIAKLSGGERRRLYLLKVIMGAPNILLLDEPSNDLDIETLTILEDYLEDFQGAVVVVSHDRYFLDKVVDQILEFSDDGTIRSYVGGYTDYSEQVSVRERKKLREASQDTPAKDSASSPQENINSNNSHNPALDHSLGKRKLKFTYKEQQEYEQIDAVIAGLEGRLAHLEKIIQAEAANYARLGELLAEKEQLEKSLAEKMERWVYLNELAEMIADRK